MIQCDEEGRERCRSEAFGVIGVEALGTIVPTAAFCLDHLAQNVNGYVTEYGRVTIAKVES